MIPVPTEASMSDPTSLTGLNIIMSAGQATNQNILRGYWTVCWLPALV